ncbi:hypothetical protein N7456_007032 [Penicillium angulare]|uniref:Calcium-independent phospholipase A2-gamma n=1 Tax=Penicillium angulare TaxID=116970 RepID=A0A9W9KC66_9EURO|nr:hypothetical protein N7456_007032 [Penicillium angulare]
MAAWLDLVREDGVWSLVDTHRLEELVKEMPYPSCQYPCLLFFVGNANRMRALRTLFPQNNVSRQGPAGMVRLHLSARTAHTEQPILFAESAWWGEKSLGDTKWLRYATHLHQRHTLTDVGGELVPARLRQQLAGHLVIPWTQMMCLFVDTSVDLKAAGDLLRLPRRPLAVGDECLSNALHVVMVTEKIHPEDIWAQVSLWELSHADRLTILDLRERSRCSDDVAFEPLRGLILDRLPDIWTAQQSDYRLFSALHLGAFWKLSLQHPLHILHTTPLDLLAHARRNFAKAPSMHESLCEGVRLMQVDGYTEGNIYGAVASALLMDAYPPGMHGFSPVVLMKKLYGEWWAAERADERLGRYGCVLSRFKQYFAQLSPLRSSASIRKTTLTRLHRQGGEGALRSAVVCLVCLSRPPEHMLPCRHALCDTCVVIFGQPSELGLHHINIPECPLCGCENHVVIRQLPPTKGPLILSLDGGGVRGLLQLRLLRALEERIGLPINSLPDLCAGTSVGALSAINLFLNDRSLDECLDVFPSFAQRIFRRARLPVPRCFRWMMSAFNLLTGGLYDSSELSGALKEAVGPEHHMFAPARTSPAGCRVALVASRTSDGKACVLANYRGSGQRCASAAYRFLVTNSPEGPLLADAAMCSVAAPFYFHTTTLPEFGPFQDGGVRANNPVAIAMRETNVIWPSSSTFDLILSVGTGFSRSSHRPQSGLLRWLWEGALPRLWRAMMSSPCLDGTQGFAEALNYFPSDSHDRILRLDQEIDGPLPHLDDVSALQEFSMMDLPVSDHIVRKVLVRGLFFFELDDIPVRTHAGFSCKGSVLCSRPEAAPILGRVLVEFPHAWLQISNGHKLECLGVEDCCLTCGHFRKGVSFAVSSLEERFSIHIANDCHREMIGGFPKSLLELLQEQQAFDHFGRADHQNSVWPRVRSCNCFRRSKRKLQIVEPSVANKKRRL